MATDDMVTSRIAGLATLLEELRAAIATHIKDGALPGGGDSAWIFNVGYLLGGCAGIDMADSPMALFSRIHRIHAALVEIEVPPAVLEIVKRLYAAAFDAHLAVLSTGTEA